jgi:biotin carboxyl carrier protein
VTAAGGAATPFRRKLLKTATAIAVATVIAYLPARYFFEPASTEAIVNARVVSLRAPIDGAIGVILTVAPGDAVEAGAIIGIVRNRRAEPTRLDDMSRAAGVAADEGQALDRRLAALIRQRDDLGRQTDNFRIARIERLKAKQAEAEADAEAEAAILTAAESARERSQRLMRLGAESQAGFDAAQRDAATAAARGRALEKRREALAVEIDALEKGVFVGDSYNDRPSSAQRLDDAVQRIAEIEAMRSEQEMRLIRLRRDLANERTRFEAVAEAAITAPIAGRVWEVLTADREEVARGQELFRLLDCSSMAITALVGEQIYNRLAIGGPAEFRMAESHRRFDGRITSLTGMAAAQSNFAIAGTDLERARFRVTISVPALANEPNCAVGRTGRIVFGPSPTAD